VRVPNQIAHALVDNGLWDGSKVMFNANGGIKNMKGNPLSAANTKLFEENPELFYEQVIRPMYKKMNLSAEDIARENLALFGRTGGKLFEAIERSLPVIQQSVEAMKKTKSITDSVAEAKKSLGGQETEFSAAWTDFKTQFGTTMLPFFTGILKGGAAILRGMSDITPGHAVLNPVSSAGQVVANVLKSLGVSMGSTPSAKGNESPFVSNAVKTAQAIHNKIVMPNGRVLAEIVTQVQAKDMARPQAGTSGFDGRQGLVPAGSN
jgi:hypothetical protein